MAKGDQARKTYVDDLLKREQDYLDALNSSRNQSKQKAAAPSRFESDIDRIIRETKEQEKKET